MNEKSLTPIHWAEFTAERIIREKGDKEEYVLASGITPSGVVHFGNFREVITVDLVARALRARGKKVRFIFSWDDYDTFRKVPLNLPKRDELEKYLFRPIVETPDPFDEEESYARHHEIAFERQLEKVGIQVEFIYQAKKYRNGDYKNEIKKALKNKNEIMAILNQYRTSPLPENWLPISVYCHKYHTDQVQDLEYDGENTISYKHILHDYRGEENLETTSQVKLPWRVDWPMRWAYEGVDFEPGGKDHSSEGGSYTTAKEIVKLFGGTPPIYLQYDFVSIKGAGGKMSSSKGNLITVNDVLDIYEPEIVRWIFASYKSNVDFSISFDLDVLKTYEDFDRQERLVYGKEAGNEKKVAMAKRVYEYSQIESEIPKEMPFQPSFRHLCNVLQIHGGDLQKTKQAYQDEILNERDERRFQQRATCALFWIENYAPEEFKFSLNHEKPSLELNEKEVSFLKKLSNTLKENWENYQTDKDLHEDIYKIIHEVEVTPNEIFPVIYKTLINKEKGPKLAGFIRTIGKDRSIELFS